MRIIFVDEKQYELQLKKNGTWETIVRGSQKECLGGIGNVVLDKI